MKLLSVCYLKIYNFKKILSTDFYFAIENDAEYVKI